MCSLFTAQADPVSTNGLSFEEIPGGLRVTACTSESREIEIPAYVNGTPVTAIGEYAFYRSEAERIVLPDTVTSIGECAFWRCAGLKDIRLPDGVTEIGSGAFCDCAALEEFTIPAAVQKVDDGFLTGCASLQKILVDGENPVYASKDGALFTKDMKALISYPYGRDSLSYTIPATVERLGSFAFFGAAVDAVYVPDGVVFEETTFLKR